MKSIGKKSSLLIEFVPIIIWGIIMVHAHIDDEHVYILITVGGFYFFWSNIVAYFTGGFMANMTHYYEAEGDQENLKDRKWFAVSCMIMLPLWILECLYYADIFD